MRTLSTLLLALLISPLALAERPAKPAVPATSETAAAESNQWKGKPYDTRFQFAALTGLGVMGAGTGFALYGAAAYKILHEGFIDDVNDQTYLEIQAGPLFVGGPIAANFSMHLRWDFHKNDMWTFYSLGGVGMQLLGTTSNFIYPRIAVGTMWNLFEFMSFRLEVSHEFMGAGVVWLL